jgi:hypothetical protein
MSLVNYRRYFDQQTFVSQVRLYVTIVHSQPNGFNGAMRRMRGAISDRALRPLKSRRE